MESSFKTKPRAGVSKRAGPSLFFQGMVHVNGQHRLDARTELMHARVRVSKHLEAVGKHRLTGFDSRLSRLGSRLTERW